MFFTGLLLVYVFYFISAGRRRRSAGSTCSPRAPPRVDRVLLIDSLIARRRRDLPGGAGPAALPAVTLALFSLAPIARMTRGLDAGGAVGAISCAPRARAASARRKVVFTYAFRNAMLPVITTLGMVFSFLLGANVLVEKVFAWPGVGSYAVEALIASDYAPVQGFVLAMAILYIVLNLLIDVLYGVIDPRVRIEA